MLRWLTFFRVPIKSIKSAASITRPLSRRDEGRGGLGWDKVLVILMRNKRSKLELIFCYLVVQLHLFLLRPLDDWPEIYDCD
jgi:hypothetical protein